MNLSIMKKWNTFKQSIYFNTFCYFWSGIFATLSFAPYSLAFFSLLAPMGLFWIEDKYRGKYKILLKKGLLFSIVMCTLSYYWINHMLTVFGGFPLFLSIPLFLLYCIIVNWKFGVFMVIFSYLKTKLGRRNFILAGFCILVAEFGTWQIFPWYYGNLLASNIILAQTVEYFGVYGLSVLTFIVSYAIYKFPFMAFAKRNSKKKILFAYSFPLYILISFFALGTFLFLKWESQVPTKIKQVLMIQPDAPLEFRDGRFKETMDLLMEKIEKLVLEGSKEIRPDIIVLPESGVPFFSANNTAATTTYETAYWYRYEALIYQLTNRYKANFYFNEIDASFENDIVSKENLRFHNNSVVYDPNGDRKDFYRKSYLLAFGEYIPLGETFPFLYELIPQVGRFLPGTEQNLLTYYKPNSIPKFQKSFLKWEESSYINMQNHKEYFKENRSELTVEGKFLPLICYEVILPEFVRKFYKKEMPDFIINITNDKWYGDTVESYEHLDLARLRSIEFRRWMVRSTNSGTSAFVDHLGRIVGNQTTKLLSAAQFSKSVPVFNSEPTFYLKYGNLLAWIFLFLFSAYGILKVKFF